MHRGVAAVGQRRPVRVDPDRGGDAASPGSGSGAGGGDPERLSHVAAPAEESCIANDAWSSSDGSSDGSSESSDNGSDDEPDDGAENKWVPLHMIRVVPLSGFMVFVCMLASVNLVVCLISATADVRGSWSQSSGDVYGVAGVWIVLMAAIAVPVVWQAVDFWKGTPQVKPLLSVWLAWLPGFNLLYHQIKTLDTGWSMGNVPSSADWLFPRMSFVWDCVVALQHLHVTTDPPKDWRQGLALLGHWLTAVMILAKTFAQSTVWASHWHYFFLQAQWSQIQAEALHLVQTREAAGCRALSTLMIWMQVAWSFAVVDFWTSNSRNLHCLFLASALLAAVLQGALNGLAEERLNVAVPMWRKQGGLTQRCVPALVPALTFFRTWTGANVIFFFNGCVGLVVYVLVYFEVRSQEQTETSRCMDFTHAMPCQLSWVRRIIAMCLASIFISAWNLLKETLLPALSGHRSLGRQAEGWAAAVVRVLPSDRHLRVTTCVKMVLVWSKVMLYRFSPRKDHLESLTVAQLACIAGTSIVSARTVLHMYSAKNLEEDCRGRFRHPEALLRSIQAALLAILAITALALEAHAAGGSGTSLANLVSLVMVFPLLYFVGNEIFLCISPKAFPECTSVRGLRCSAFFFAFFMPIHVLGRIVLATPTNTPFSDLWLFHDSWQASVIGYGAATIFVCCAVMCWASSPRAEACGAA